MFGTESSQSDQRGINFRALEDLFALKTKRQEEVSGWETCSMQSWCVGVTADLIMMASLYCSAASAGIRDTL